MTKLINLILLNRSEFFINQMLVSVLFLVASFQVKAQLYINEEFSFGGLNASFEGVTFGPNADVTLDNGSSFYIYGTATVVDEDAKFSAPTSPTGLFIFAGTTAEQTLNGGNSAAIGGAQPSLINIEIDNSDGLSLFGSNTRVIGDVLFTDGHITLNGQNFELSENATITDANENKYFITNGAGFLAKENFSDAFLFPVGMAKSDYTPATIHPNDADNFFVRVAVLDSNKVDLSLIKDGVDREWNIYSTGGEGANIKLKHNSVTEGDSFVNNNAFVTQYRGGTTWQVGTGALGTNSGTGTEHNRDYTSTATSASNHAAFFSKSSQELTPLPVTLLHFTAKKNDVSSTLLTWATSLEINSDYFEVQTSADAIAWTNIGRVSAQGTSNHITNYEWIHPNPVMGINYYRLYMVDFDGSAEYSLIRNVNFEADNDLYNHIAVYPNPAKEVVYIRSQNISYQYTLMNMEGKILTVFENNEPGSDLLSVDLSAYSFGLYFLTAYTRSLKPKVFKIIVTK